MPDYQKMYRALFNDVTDAIRALEEAQKKTEEMYMDGSEPGLWVLTGQRREETAPD